MNTLLIGGSGFTGTHLQSLLRTQHSDDNILSVSRGSVPSLDLTDRSNVDAVLGERAWDRVICLAACMRSPEPADFVNINVDGMGHLLEGLEASGFTGRLLVVGSSAVYGNMEQARDAINGAQEDHAPCLPVSAYGETMLEREQLVRQVTARAGFSTIITRTFNLLGPDLPSFYAFSRFSERTHQLLSGASDSVEVGPLEAIRDFVDVRDACVAYDALLHVAVSPGEAVTVNVCSEVGQSIGSFFPIVEKEVGQRIPTQVNPEWVNPREVRRQVGDGSRLRELTGWRPQISYEQSVLDLFRNVGTAHPS